MLRRTTVLLFVVAQMLVLVRHTSSHSVLLCASLSLSLSPSLPPSLPPSLYLSLLNRWINVLLLGGGACAAAWTCQ
jgi:hypothetical protein